MWAPAAIMTASKPYTNGRQGRIPQDYVDLSTAIHAVVQDHSLIVSLALPGLHYKERVHDDVALHKSCFRQHMEQVQKTGAPPPSIFSTAPILVNMTLFVLVNLAICFSVRPILSSTLTYLNIRNYVLEHNYRWEKIAGIVVGIGLTGLGITGIIAIATAPHSTQEVYHWFNAVIMCNL
jgi:hypothetical protein